MFTLKPKATSAPDLAVLQDHHLRKGVMHITGNEFHDQGRSMISFKGAQYPKDVILFAVFFYVR